MNNKLREIKHDYINDNKAVNYICISGQEYVIGEYDTFEEALDQFTLVEKINNDNSVDWVSSRPGDNMK